MIGKKRRYETEDCIFGYRWDDGGRIGEDSGFYKIGTPPGTGKWSQIGDLQRKESVSDL